MPGPRAILNSGRPYRSLVGVGGIGSGAFFALEGDHTLGRNESRPARRLHVRDYCKLHIIAHHVAVLLGATARGQPFHVVPIGKVGDDDAGQGLRAEMAQAGMDTRFVSTVPDRPTLYSVCFQYPDGSGGNITTADSACAALGPADVDALEPLIREYGEECIVLAAPEVPLELRMRLLEVGTRAGACRAAALATGEIEAALSMGLLAAVDVLSLNEDEATALAGRELQPDSPCRFMSALSEALARHNPSMIALVTAGKHGAYLLRNHHHEHCPAIDVRAVSTAGAGDALFGTVLACMAAGIPCGSQHDPSPAEADADRGVDSALSLGVLAAGLSITSPHTISPGLDLAAVLAFARERGLAIGKRVAEAVVGRL